MAKIAGRLQSLSTDGTAINGIVDANLAGENNMIDTTTHDENSRSFIYGRFSGTIDGTLKWDDTDTGQEAVKDDFFAATTSVYVFRMETLSGADEYTGTGLVSSFGPSGPNDDAGEMAFTIQLTGTLTRSAQA